MADTMTFPETWEEFEKSYGFVDGEEVYTNGSRLIPSFRVKQWLDHIAHRENEQQSKQQATVSSDCISRQAAIDALELQAKEMSRWAERYTEQAKGVLTAKNVIEDLPSAQQEIIRCRDCKHYYYADNRIPQEQRYSCALDGDRWKPEDFCSYAERKTE